MSKRYIDADELIECFDGYPDYVEFDVEDIESIINEQDVADVAEVVRCKNCKYNAKGDNESEFRNLCILRPLVYVPVSDEDYCSRGEKKDEWEGAVT